MLVGYFQDRNTEKHRHLLKPIQASETKFTHLVYIHGQCIVAYR